MSNPATRPASSARNENASGSPEAVPTNGDPGAGRGRRRGRRRGGRGRRARTTCGGRGGSRRRWRGSWAGRSSPAPAYEGLWKTSRRFARSAGQVAVMETTQAPVVPGFGVGRLLGQRRDAHVWEAVRLGDGRRVALKVFARRPRGRRGRGARGRGVEPGGRRARRAGRGVPAPARRPRGAGHAPDARGFAGPPRRRRGAPRAREVVTVLARWPRPSAGCTRPGWSTATCRPATSCSTSTGARPSLTSASDGCWGRRRPPSGARPATSPRR